MTLQNLLHNPMTSGVILVLMTCLALFWANSNWSDSYHHVLEFRFSLIGLDRTIHFVINDVLMAIFFLLVGLEIKRELVIGELSTRANALQPIFAAVGGVVVPALCFLLVNTDSNDTLAGWAIPCATDIAFALGVLALLGSRVSPALAILLTAIAIIDDLIAILVIGLFYTQDLQPVYLLWAALAGMGLAWLNYKNISSLAAYIAFGVVLWIMFYKTGLHPTMAGVVTALAVPVRGNNNMKRQVPLLRLERMLHPWVAFAIVPLFALANAGLYLGNVQMSDFQQPLTLGIIVGLMVGKPVGIMAGLYIGHLSGIAKKSVNLSWMDYTGIAFLCGIGFTMSLFIGDLGFESATYKEQVKLGVLMASFCMAVLGWILCRVTLKKPAHNTI